MTISVIGTASATIAGKAGKVTASSAAYRRSMPAALPRKDALITAEGASTIDAAVSNAVKVDADGPATIRLAGRPACTLRITGSADVSGCR